MYRRSLHNFHPIISSSRSYYNSDLIVKQIYAREPLTLPVQQSSRLGQSSSESDCKFIFVTFARNFFQLVTSRCSAKRVYQSWKSFGPGGTIFKRPALNVLIRSIHSTLAERYRRLIDVVVEPPTTNESASGGVTKTGESVDLKSKKTNLLLTTEIYEIFTVFLLF